MSDSCFFPSESRMNCPNVDVLTWTFENLGNYDQDKPARLMLYVDAGDPARSLSAREALLLVRRLVSGFKKFGLESGDCVCIHLFNERAYLKLAYPITWLGTIGAGGCISGSNPSYSSLEFKHHLKISNAKFVITQPDLLEIVADAVRENNIPRSRVLVLTRQGGHIPDGYASWEELLQHGESDWIRFDDKELAQNTAAAISSTSGTTGFPKGALLSHQNLVAQNILITTQGNKPYEISYLLAIPIFHGFAGGLAHITPLRTGHTVYLMRRFEMQPFLDAIYRFNITEITVVPPILTQILISSVNPKPLLRSLRYILCAGAALDPKIQTKMYDVLSPGAIVGQVWGLTELGWITQFQWPERDDTGSVGRQGPSQEMKLVNEDLQPITEPNKEGEACVRGPNLFKGYLGDPTFNEEAFTHDGWFKTGDLMLCKEGKWYITGRRKDVFKVRGRQVSPNELESVLLGHPQISDVAIVGVPARWPATGDAPRAYVIRKSPTLSETSQNGSARLLSEADVKEWIVQRLARYKALDGGVEFVESIPRTASGKILRRLLRIKEQVAG